MRRMKCITSQFVVSFSLSAVLLCLSGCQGDAKEEASAKDSGKQGQADPANAASPRNDEADAKKVVAAYLDAVKKNDDNAVKAVLTAKAKKLYTKSPTKPSGDDASYTIGEVTIKNNVASVKAVLKDKRMSTPGFFRLRREENKWRIFGMGIGGGNEKGDEAGAFFLDFEVLKPITSKPGKASDRAGRKTGRRSARSSKKSRKDQPSHPTTTVKQGGASKKITLAYEPPMGIMSRPDNPIPPMYGILEFSGEAFTNATAYGSLKVNLAQDDTGNKLKLRPTPRFGNKKSAFDKLPNFLMFPGASGPYRSKKIIKIPLILDSPPLSAKQLDRLEGSVQIVAGGERKKVVVAKVLEKLGSEISDPALKKAGLTIKIDRPDPKKNKTQEKNFAITVQGPVINLLEYKLLGSDDKSLITYTSRHGSGETTKFQFGVSKKLPADVRLVLEVAIDQQPVTVHFKFQNVKLPVSPENEPAKILTTGIQQKLTLSHERPRNLMAAYGLKALFATIEITGEPIANASHYGVFQLTTIKDDKGTNLKLLKPVTDRFQSALAKQYIQLNSFSNKPKDTIKFHLILNKPSPNAKQLDLLEGSIRLKGRDSIVIDGVLDKVGTTLTDSRLKAVGSLEISKPAKNDNVKPGHGLVVKFNGKLENIHRLDLIDGKGSKINSGSSSFSFGGKKTWNITANKKLPPGTQLKITLGGDEKVTEIPFKFNNFPLPEGVKKKKKSGRKSSKTRRKRSK